ncbi:MAG TPA: 16S rRNA (guanine(527)-N(7))-methyltransferase RsmG [Chondromyces sp.]|nr:16S rRNA (guanine(527)-N(7))-methyltransferase RsmG [Chondromyces sp.]
MNTEKFKQLLEEKGISLSPWQLEQYETYYKLLVEWNEKMNLTAITDHDEVYLKHFFDSLTAAFYFDFNQDINLCDVGAGAGFPSIPIKIAFPNIHVTIVDSLNKRIGFLEHLSKELKLENTHFYHDRAETFGKNPEHREQYNVVTARAVARMSVLSELCLPLVKQDGVFLAMKAASADEELAAAKKAINILGGRVEKEFSFKLPIEESERNIMIIRKVKPAPKKYPRKPGTPNKQPIE